MKKIKMKMAIPEPAVRRMSHAILRTRPMMTRNGIH